MREVLATSLVLQVYDKDLMSRSALLGEVTVSLKELLNRDVCDFVQQLSTRGSLLFTVEWVPFQSRPPKMPRSKLFMMLQQYLNCLPQLSVCSLAINSTARPSVSRSVQPSTWHHLRNRAVDVSCSYLRCTTVRQPQVRVLVDQAAGPVRLSGSWRSAIMKWDH